MDGIGEGSRADGRAPSNGAPSNRAPSNRAPSDGAGLPGDELILARLRAGDEVMFAQLLDSWSGAMLRAARAYVSTRESAEDVVQETWLAVIRGIDRFEGRSSLRTWVYRILVNTAKTRGVKESRTVPFSDVDIDAGPTVRDWPQS